MSVSPATDIFAVARYFPCSSQRFPAGPRASGLRDGGVQGALVRFLAGDELEVSAVMAVGHRGSASMATWPQYIVDYLGGEEPGFATMIKGAYLMPI